MGKFATATQTLKDTPMVSSITPGEMYLFYYDPKYKDELAYYDRLPLVLPFRKVPGGFYGINLHYLPYLMRFRILQKLSEYSVKETSTIRKHEDAVVENFMGGNSYTLSPLQALKIVAA